MHLLHHLEVFTWLKNADLLDRNIPYRTQLEMYEEYGDYLTFGETEEEGQSLADEMLEEWKRIYPRVAVKASHA